MPVYSEQNSGFRAELRVMVERPPSYDGNYDEPEEMWRGEYEEEVMEEMRAEAGCRVFAVHDPEENSEEDPAGQLELYPVGVEFGPLYAPAVYDMANTSIVHAQSWAAARIAEYATDGRLSSVYVVYVAPDGTSEVCSSVCLETLVGECV